MNALKFVILEDDEGHYTLMKRAIEHEFPQARLHHFVEAQVCLEKLSSLDPDVFIIDYLMPGMNGIEFLEALNGSALDIPIIMTTGQGDERIAVRAMKLGAWDYLVKSADFFQLLPSIIHKVIREKNLRRSLQESARLNSVLLNSLPHPAMLISHKRIILAANRAALNLGARIGGHCWQTFCRGAFLSSEHGQRLKEHPGEAPPSDIRCAFCKAEAAIGRSLSQNVPVFNAFGRLWDVWWIPVDENCFFHYALDITERLRAEKALQDQLHFLQTLIDTIPNPIFYKDINGYYLGCNKAFEARVGKTRAEIIGKTSSHIFPSPFNEMYIRMDEQALRSGGEQVFETSLRYANGTIANVIIYKGSFTDADGRLAGLVGVTVDITERKRAEEALRRAHDELELRVQERTAELARTNEELRVEIEERQRAEEALRESSEKLKLFAYSVAHDLKSPVTGIHGLTKLLQRRYSDNLDEKGKTVCEQILNASEHVVALVDKINTFAATKEAPLVLERLSIKEVLRALRDEFASRLKQQGVTWQEPDELPEVNADRLCMLRIFRNLVDNALKYGGEELSRIVIGYEERPDCHIFRVADDGVGITEEDSEWIFDLFQRRSASRSIEGTGLGLAIVKEIAAQHGGKAWFKPGPRRGATFFFSIAQTSLCPTP